MPAEGCAPLMMMLENRPNDHDNDREQKHEDGNTVDPMHIPHPLRTRRIRIPFLDIEVLLDLSPNTHNNMLNAQPRPPASNGPRRPM